MTIVVTNATGGTAQPVEALYVPLDRQVLDPSAGTTLADTGLDAAFVADLLSACVCHERCGAHLYRSVAGRTTDDNLRVQYERFGDETLEHVDKLEQLIAAAGGDPQYVSPSARATEMAASGLLQSTYLISGSIDPVTAELAMLEAVMLAEVKDRANWMVLAQLAEGMAEGDVRTQFQAVVSEVLAQEEEHYGWASDTRSSLLLMMAGASSTAPKARAASGAEPTRDELYAEAQQLDVAGRSQMSKDELAAAVKQHRQNEGGRP
jgi:rubrerythrin